MEDKTLGFLGILYRGGRVMMGEKARENISMGRYAFLAKDASANSTKEALALIKRAELPYDASYSKEELGQAIGYDEISFLLVTDKKAAKKLIEYKEKRI